MTELKPCPFCGGEAELHPTYDMDTNEVDGWFVWCNNDTCECKPETWQFFTEAEAIAVWNTRAERTCHVKASYDTGDVDNRGSNAEWYFAFSCGCELYWDESEPPNYCPNCGAKVVGE